MSDRKIESLSMGCQIATTVCSVCGVAGPHIHKGGVAQYDPEDYSGVQFLAFSMVPAPNCSQCREPMEYLKRGTDWACRDALCTAFNQAVTTGVGGIIQ
jgi:LSD1 subclass zinc finger protein